MLYLDNAATTVRKPLSVYMSLIYNTLFRSFNAGRGAHSRSLKASEIIIDTQEIIAQLLNIDNPQNIAFMPNATYALNAAILGAHAGKHIVVSQMEHNSVLRPVHSLGNYSIVPADTEGRVSAESFKSVITADTGLVICTHASNVCGTIEPVAEIAAAAHEAGALFLLDASQTIGSEKIDNAGINADFIAFPGHKGLMGPLGTGVLYVKDINTIDPVITGGTGSLSDSLLQPRIMPDMLHSGTVNTPAVAALGSAVKYILKHREEIRCREAAAVRAFEERLRGINGVKLYGNANKTGISAFNIGNYTSDEAEELLRGKIALRSGFHCAPLAHKALGTENTGLLRVSFGAFDGIDKAKRAAEAVAALLFLCPWLNCTKTNLFFC